MNDVSRIVFVVDDDPHVCQAIGQMAKALGYACETFGDAMAFLASYDVNDDREQCLLLDYYLPEIDGLDLIKSLPDRGIAVPVVLITGQLEPNVAVEAMRGGAVNCVQKPFSLANFQTVVEDAFASIPNIKKLHEAKKHHARFGRLTNQEKAIVRMAAEGFPNKQIASRLGLSIKTVEKYRRRAYATLNVDSTARMTRAVTLHTMHSMFGPRTNTQRSSQSADSDSAGRETL